MEVKVSNVSKLAPKEVLRNLFKMVGIVLCFEHYPDVISRDGSYCCDVVFANLHEARRALRLTGTSLGDRQFVVSLITNPKRFRSVAPSERIRKIITHEKAVCHTGLVTGLPSNNNLLPQEIGSLCGGSRAIRDVVKLDGGREALVEFTETTGISLAVERLKLSSGMYGSRVRIEEAWRLIDPDYLPVKDLNASHSSLDVESAYRKNRGPSHPRSRSPSKSRHSRDSRYKKSRSRSGSRSRSRSPRRRSPARYHHYNHHHRR